MRLSSGLYVVLKLQSLIFTLTGMSISCRACTECYEVELYAPIALHELLRDLHGVLQCSCEH